MATNSNECLLKKCTFKTIKTFLQLLQSAFHWQYDIPIWVYRTFPPYVGIHITVDYLDIKRRSVHRGNVSEIYECLIRRCLVSYR